MDSAAAVSLKELISVRRSVSDKPSGGGGSLCSNANHSSLGTPYFEKSDISAVGTPFVTGFWSDGVQSVTRRMDGKKKKS